MFHCSDARCLCEVGRRCYDDQSSVSCGPGDRSLRAGGLLASVSIFCLALCPRPRLLVLALFVDLTFLSLHVRSVPHVGFGSLLPLFPNTNMLISLSPDLTNTHKHTLPRHFPNPWFRLETFSNTLTSIPLGPTRTQGQPCRRPSARTAKARASANTKPNWPASPCHSDRTFRADWLPPNDVLVPATTTTGAKSHPTLPPDLRRVRPTLRTRWAFSCLPPPRPPTL